MFLFVVLVEIPLILNTTFKGWIQQGIYVKETNLRDMNKIDFIPFQENVNIVKVSWQRSFGLGCLKKNEV